jgi:CheY-like chemotaxis protein
VARDGRQALRILAQYPGLHQLVLANIVLPDMGGGELADRVGDHRAGTRVVLVAEYAPIGNAAAVLAAHPNVPVLRKPFGFRELYAILSPLIGPPRAALPLSGSTCRPRRRRKSTLG